jgi:hypothetical protein
MPLGPVYDDPMQAPSEADLAMQARTARVEAGETVLFAMRPMSGVRSYRPDDVLSVPLRRRWWHKLLGLRPARRYRVVSVSVYYLEAVPL